MQFKRIIKANGSKRIWSDYVGRAVLSHAVENYYWVVGKLGFDMTSTIARATASPRALDPEFGHTGAKSSLLKEPTAYN
jgi:hypothetical protein